MASVFAITAPDESVKANAAGRADITFTISNATRRPLRGRAVLVADAAAMPWLSIDGEVERDFPVDGVQQFAVRLSAPTGAQATGTLRLKVVSVELPDEDFTVGPPVGFEVTATEPRPPAIPWWLIVIAVVVLLLVAGTVTWWLWPRSSTVPEVTGHPLVEAEALLEEADLTVGDITKQESSSLTDTVLDQDPEPGEKLRVGRPVHLVVAVPEPLVEVPTIHGLTHSQALDSLKKAGLTVGLVTPSDAGTVAQADPRPGVRVPRGSAVDLRMGR